MRQGGYLHVIFCSFVTWECQTTPLSLTQYYVVSTISHQNVLYQEFNILLALPTDNSTAELNSKHTENSTLSTASEVEEKLKPLAFKDRLDILL